MRSPQSTTNSQGQRYVVSVERRLAIPSSVYGEAFERKESRALSFRPREHRECEYRSWTKSDTLHADLLYSDLVLCGAVTTNTLNTCNNSKYRKTRSLPRSRERKRQRVFRHAKGEGRRRHLCCSGSRQNRQQVRIGAGRTAQRRRRLDEK